MGASTKGFFSTRSRPLELPPKLIVLMTILLILRAENPSRVYSIVFSGLCFVRRLLVSQASSRKS